MLICVGLTLVVLAATVALGEQVLLARYEHSMRHSSLLSKNSRRPVTGLTVRGPLNYLLLGSDARPGQGEEGQRSDTIIILHVPAKMDRGYLISVPRDLRVDLPAAPEVGFPGGTEKINAAFFYGSRQDGEAGGFRLLSTALRQLTGVRFDGAAIIDFTGFQNAVRVLGGVDLCVDTPTRSIHTGTVYQPGCRHMQPWEALDYLRQRYDQPNGDYDRQRHQQQFIKAILTRARQQDVTGNPAKLDATVRAIGQALTVDTNGVPMDRLAYALRNVQPSALVGLRVPSYPEVLDEVSYVVADAATAEELYGAIRTDRLDGWTRDHPEWVNSL